MSAYLCLYPRNVFFMQVMLQAGFLSLTFGREDFCCLFIQNNTPNPLESWNVIDLNSLLGPCSVRANVLVFLFELKLALGRNRWCSFEGNKSLCLSNFSCRLISPLSPLNFFPFFLVENFESYLEYYISGFTNSPCSRCHF